MCSISGNDYIGYTYDCSGRGFESIPTDFHVRTTRIKLNENNLQDIPRNVFKTYRLLVSLDLSNNKVSRIDVDAFCSCSSLKNLSLQNNTLQSNEKSFPVGSFSSLVNLRSLHLFGMNLRDVNYTTTEICRNLHSLVTLEIDIWDEFQLSQHCSQLQNLKLLTLKVRQRIKFLNQSFEVLDGLPIEVLRLQGTLNDGLYSKPIEVGVLRPLHKLKTLEIDSFSVCYISYLLRTIIYPFRNKTMDLIFKNLIDIPFQSLSSSDLKYIKDICVRKLIMTTVSIQSFDAGELLNSRLWHCLEEFDISRNFLRSNTYTFGFSLPRVRILNFCCQLTRQGYPLEQESDVSKSRRSIMSKFVMKVAYEFYLSNHLKVLSFENNDLHLQKYDIDLTVHANGVEMLSLRKFHFENCIGTLRGFKNLKVLIMEGWNCGIINPKFIANFTSVKELTFSSMQLGYNAKTMVSLLANWTHLSYVDLSNNDIDAIHPDFFLSQRRSMKNISLANNKLTFIPKTVMSLRALQHIDMRHNSLSTLTQGEMEFLDRQSDLTMQLAGNVFQCTCTTLPFLLWLEANSQRVKDFKHLSCTDEENVKRNMSVFIKELRVKQLKCASKTALYFAVFGNIFLILCVILTFTLVKFQADVQYIFARIRRHFRSKTERLQCKEKYHAFVSYGNTNYHWTVWELKPKLEREGFRLMFPDFHFNLGGYDSENILDAIDNSRRIIFVITRDFLTDE